MKSALKPCKWQMSDEIDMASELETLFRDAAINQARKQKQIPSIGHCYYCNDVVDNGIRFCSADCREDYELEQEAYRRHNGRR